MQNIPTHHVLVGDVLPMTCWAYVDGHVVGPATSARWRLTNPHAFRLDVTEGPRVQVTVLEAGECRVKCEHDTTVKEIQYLDVTETLWHGTADTVNWGPYAKRRPDAVVTRTEPRLVEVERVKYDEVRLVAHERGGAAPPLTSVLISVEGKHA
jgi:hypothetical protein